jgi:hypothetical protein
LLKVYKKEWLIEIDNGHFFACITCDWIYISRLPRFSKSGDSIEGDWSLINYARSWVNCTIYNCFNSDIKLDLKQSLNFKNGSNQDQLGYNF